MENSDKKLMSQNPLVYFKVPVFILGLKHKYFLDDHFNLVASELRVEFTVAFGL